MKDKLSQDYAFYDQPGRLAISHRGGDAAGADKENTIVAFQSAYDAGIIYGETDTIVTADGVPLAYHGARTEKQKEQFGLPTRDELQALTLDEINSLIRIGGELVPTLEEVLMTFPGMRFYIDPKTKEVVKPLANLINKLHVQDRVSIGAFDYRRTQAVAELAGGQRDICTAIGVIGSVALLGSAINIPGATTYLERTQAASFNLPHNYVDQNMVERAHELGMHIVLWTPNTQETIDSSLATGADGVMSDRTEMLKKTIDKFNSSN